MAERIPQSVAKLVVFRAYLASDGKTPATGKTIAITISKNGATSFSNPAAGATNATEMASGFYKFTLGTGDTDTQGPLAWRGAEGTINDAGDAFSVVSAFNAGFSGIPDAAADAAGGLPVSDAGGLDLDTFLGRLTGNVATAAKLLAYFQSALRKDVTVDADIGGNYDDATDSQEAIRDNMGTAQTGDAYAVVNSGTHGNAALKTLIDTAQSGITTLLSRVTGAVALASTFTGITSLAEWLGLIAGKQSGDATARTELRATGAGSGTFDETTDSQEAIRDNIGTAGAGLTAADDAVITAIGALNNVSAAQVKTQVDTALADIHLDHLLATTYDPASKPGAADALLNELVENDGGVARYTANALEQAPTGGSAPTAEEIADEVRVELATELGRMDAAVSTRATPAQVATELATYDGPTNAEMVARTLASASYATAAAQSTLQTSVDDIPTNAELATALGTADDAVLAAIAALNNLSSAGAQAAAAAALTAYSAATSTNVSNAQTAILAKLPAALSANGNIKADVKEVNDVELQGVGVIGDAWRPA